MAIRPVRPGFGDPGESRRHGAERRIRGAYARSDSCGPQTTAPNGPEIASRVSAEVPNFRDAYLNRTGLSGFVTTQFAKLCRDRCSAC
jgi:hypothetical protein